MIESAGESSDVGDESAPVDEDGLVPGHADLLQVDQDLLHIVDLLVHLVALEDQGNESVTCVSFAICKGPFSDFELLKITIA